MLVLDDCFVLYLIRCAFALPSPKRLSSEQARQLEPRSNFTSLDSFICSSTSLPLARSLVHFCPISLSPPTPRRSKSRGGIPSYWLHFEWG